MTKAGYVYLWEYRVKPGAEAQFHDYYNPDGRWAQLFRRARGYLGTALYHDREQADRYLTLDFWETEEAFRNFRAQFAAEFYELDRFCESLTVSEKALGTYTTVSH